MRPKGSLCVDQFTPNVHGGRDNRSVDVEARGQGGFVLAGTNKIYFVIQERAECRKW
jgi:hypothetical protein